MKKAERKHPDRSGVDLLKIYAKNHQTSLSFYVVTVCFFLFAKTFIYGLPDQSTAIFYAVMFAISSLALRMQQDLYRKIGKAQIGKTYILNFYIGAIILQKLFYLLPWLAILFWPLHGNYVFDHLLGYVFLLCAIAYYTAVSSVFWPLFVADLSIGLLAGLGVSALNFHLQETPYISLLFILIGLYSIFFAKKLNQSVIDLAREKYKLQVAVEAAENASRAKTEFLSFMSHEIRTPMNGILGMTHFLKETKPSDEQRTYINTILDCSGTLINTLNDALDSAKIEAGKLQLHKENYNIHDIVLNAVRIMKPLAHSKNLELQTKIEDALPAETYGDPYRLQQVITNLINNAIKFTEHGSVTVRIGLTKRQFNEYICVKVTDTGIGITEEAQKELFSRFFQVRNSASPTYMGSGLGLSICRSLVQLMGGKIGLRSKPGHGSTFWFDIPYVSPVSAGKKAAGGAKDTVHLLPLRILMIEDNRLNQMIAEKQLEKHGHRVAIASTGAAGLMELTRVKPDILLLDLNLPDMSGLDIATRIKAMGTPWKEIPIIAFTASASDEVLKNCRNAGIAECLFKPYDSKDLYAAISRHGLSRASLSPDAARDMRIGASDNQKMAALNDEFGPEYTMTYLQYASEEIGRLYKGAKSAFEANDTAALKGHCHDLKSVSGSLGLIAIQGMAERLEQGPGQDRAIVAKLLEQIALHVEEDLTALKIQQKALAANPGAI